MSAIAAAGSSPQARGREHAPAHLAHGAGFIPAGAGESVQRPAGRTSSWVHPRRRGGEHHGRHGLRGGRGSSPQARGRDGRRAGRHHGRGFIPAGAGERCRGRLRRGEMRVHPRRRGGEARQLVATESGEGSSPQARGRGRSPPGTVRGRRFIPAGAGESRGVLRCGPALGVHPRRRGGEHDASRSCRRHVGSSPQARGRVDYPAAEPEPAGFIPAGAGESATSPGSSHRARVHPRRRGGEERRGFYVRADKGSSPQARGRGRRGEAGLRRPRFIPAGAGERRPRRPPCSTTTVHPRRRGGEIATSADGLGSWGSSPQARGREPVAVFVLGPFGFIPAGAGESGAGACGGWLPGVHPRRRGGERGVDRCEAGGLGSSPQARGRGEHGARARRILGFIPAGAGESRIRRCLEYLAWVHPRRRGGEAFAPPGMPPQGGSSPQARGRGRQVGRSRAAHGFIPAGAGERS